MLLAAVVGVWNLFAFVLTLSVLAVLAVGLVYWWLSINKGKAVVVPSVVGLSLDRASRELTLAGLQIDPHLEERTSDDLPENTVMHQEPAGGAITREGRRVHLVISIGARQVRIPDVRTRDLTTATQRLREFGLTVGRKAYVPHPNVPADHVIAQNPPSTVHAHQVSAVDLLFSLGPDAEPVALPDLVGLPLAQAENKLVELGLELGEVVTGVDRGKPPGVVLATTPPANTRVPMRSAVGITVNARSNETPVASPAARTTAPSMADAGAGGDLKVRLYRYDVPPEAANGLVEVKVIDGGVLRDVREYRIRDETSLLIPIPMRPGGEVLIYFNGKLDSRGARPVEGEAEAETP